MCVFNINPQCQRCVISWDSRGAYRMMSLLPQSNCSISHPLLLNAGKQSRICMPHMLPGGSVGCRYKLDFLTTRCKSGRKSGRSRLWQSFLDQALCPISLAARQTHLALCCCRKYIASHMCYDTFESFFKPLNTFWACRHKRRDKFKCKFTYQPSVTLFWKDFCCFDQHRMKLNHRVFNLSWG